MPRKEAEERAMTQLKRVRIASRRASFRSSSLGPAAAGGNRARAVPDAQIMLFDEPTSALDPEMIKEVLDVMIELAGQASPCFA